LLRSCCWCDGYRRFVQVTFLLCGHHEQLLQIAAGFWRDSCAPQRWCDLVCRGSMLAVCPAYANRSPHGIECERCGLSVLQNGLLHNGCCRHTPSRSNVRHALSPTTYEACQRSICCKCAG
jgi:hypothetical protein